MCVLEYLSSHRVPFEPLLHRPAPSATKLAQSVHVPGRQVAKSVLVKTQAGYVLAVLPSTHRIELDRLATVLGEAEARLATEDEVEQVFTDCERGALPPFGQIYGLRTIVDASLAADSEVVFEGNLRHQGLRMRYQDYEAIEKPERAPFALPIALRRRRSSHRQAG